MLTAILEMIIAFWVMGLFFKFLGFLFRAGFQILGWIFGVVGTIVSIAVVLSLIGTFAVPILVIAGVIYLIVRIANPDRA
ncbi:MAG: hypothetical protein IJV26_04520 [Lachnospiraceae bacterium]|nr:hypothetical protein [Lachnospiraceae bacterium]